MTEKKPHPLTGRPSNNLGKLNPNKKTAAVQIDVEPPFKSAYCQQAKPESLQKWATRALNAACGMRTRTDLLSAGGVFDGDVIVLDGDRWLRVAADWYSSKLF